MRCPDFLLIGAMKAGTTSLFDDLNANRRVFFPSVKEPGNLMSDYTLTEEGQGEYAALFAECGEDDVAGEASTYYTMLPEHQGVPRRARKVLSDGAKLIYIVREPVARTLSHHRHSVYWWNADPEIGDAIRNDARIVNYGRYATQIRPWVDEFGVERLLVIRFEDYIVDRKATVGTVLSFLGVSSDQVETAVGDGSNRSDEIRVANRAARGFVQGRFYQRRIRPLLGEGIREAGKRFLCRKPHRRIPPMSRDTALYLIDELYAEAEEFAGLISWEGVLWNRQEAEEKYMRTNDKAQL